MWLEPRQQEEEEGGRQGRGADVPSHTCLEDHATDLGSDLKATGNQHSVLSGVRGGGMTCGVASGLSRRGTATPIKRAKGGEKEKCLSPEANWEVKMTGQ